MMRNHSYTFRQLKTFIEAGKSHSISKAANHLFITQPAVSMQIKQLEDAFGVALIEPEGRSIKLTEAGHTFLQIAQKAIAHLHDLEVSMASFANIEKGHIRLGVVSTTKYFVPILLMAFKKKHPDITFELQIENRANLIALMENHLIDIAIMGRPPNTKEYIAATFLTNPLGVICGPESPFANKIKCEWQDLNHADFIVREPGSGTRLLMEQLFHENHIQTNHMMTISSNETIKQMVSANMGLAFISLRTVALELKQGALRLLQIDGLPYLAHWYIMHRTQKRLSPSAQLFSEFMIQDSKILLKE